jgi:hypothetical protein
MVTSFLPNTASRVPRTTEISAAFNEALKADTVTDANLRLTRSASAVPGTLSYDATAFKVSFQPRQALDLLASFTVTAGPGLTDLAGNGLAAEQSWVFRTQDGSWQTPRRLDAPDTTSVSPDIAIEADANTLAVWSSLGSSRWYEIRTATYSDSGGWSASSTLSAAGSFDAFTPQVRFDGQGNALAIWTQSAPLGRSYGVWSARYLKGQGWQAPIAVDADFADVPAMSVAVDTAGNAFAVWAKQLGPGPAGNTDIFGARFTAAGGWQSAVRLGSAANIGPYDQAKQPQVAVDGAGNAYVLWVQRTSDNPVWAVRYVVGGGWQPAVSLGAVPQGDPYGPRLAVSSSGRAMALWNAFVYAGGAYRFDLWSSYLAAPDGAWSSPALLENDDAGDAYRQAVAVDGAGNFHATWQQFTSARGSDIHYRQYTPGAGWGEPAILSTAGGAIDQNGFPSLVADRNGNLMVIWGVYTSGGTQQGAFARRFIAGEGWQPTVRIDSGAAFSLALVTSLAVSPNGSVAAIWMQPNFFRSDGPMWVNLLK